MARNRGELAVVAPLSLEKNFVHEAIANLTPDQRVAYLSNVMSIAELSAMRGSSELAETVGGYTEIAREAEFVHLHPFVPEVVAANELKRNPSDGTCGIVAEYAGSVAPGTGGGDRRTEIITFVNPDYAEGDVYRQIEADRAATDGRYSEFRNIRAAYALFEIDETISSPLTGQGEMYNHENEWRLKQVFTDTDACPVDTYVDRSNFSDDPDEVDDYTPLKKDEFMLSDWAATKDLEMRQKFGEQGYAKIIDQSLMIAGTIYKTLLHHASQDTSKGRADIDFDHILDQAFRMKGVTDNAKGFIIRFIQYNGLFGLRILARAHQQLEEVAEFEKANKPKWNQNSQPFKSSLEHRRKHIRREVVEALGMADVKQALKDIPADETGAKNQAPRFDIMVLDAFDVQFAKALGCITAGQHAKKAQNIARAYGKGVPSDRDHNPLVNMLITALGDNILVEGSSLKGDDAVEPKKQIRILASHLKSLAAQAPHGITPADLMRSVYDHSYDLSMPGIVAKFDSMGPGMGNGRRFLVVDLLKAPGKLLRTIDEMGYFSRDAQGPAITPTLSQILGTMTPDPKIAAVRVSRIRTPAGPALKTKLLKMAKHDKDGDFLHGAVIGNGEALEVVLSADKQRLELIHLPLADRYSLAKKGEIALDLGAHSRTEKKHLRNRYNVVKPSQKVDPIFGRKALVGVSVLDRGYYGTEGEGQRLCVMPNHDEHSVAVSAIRNRILS